jgi:hypothetical protein
VFAQAGTWSQTFNERNKSQWTKRVDSMSFSLKKGEQDEKANSFGLWLAVRDLFDLRSCWHGQCGI